ncbi:MAG: aspartyl/glutamyl-tRNA(Asn/Gln) amidotransferase subunit B [Candidatus Hepatoplasma scabrum]|nr:MAG: aspartyl/glutamyl-tRNA(Asn/Gln) amidotransferase subunit B [Candidatus Hepatoplasma sp.]
MKINSNIEDNYIPTFGIEIHAQLKTKTKAFSPAKNDLTAKENTNINPIDLGYPGEKPLVNKKMIEFGYRIAKALNTKLAKQICFDRKNYHYPDLAKGFQITQYYQPLGLKGKFTIIDQKGQQKDIFISDIHLEEDTAKKIRLNDYLIGYDFNRAGIPLIEIVSDHRNLNTIDDVLNYVKQIANQLIFLEVNDGKLYKGSFRVDVNVSVRNKNDKKLGTRVELKNLNSFNNIKLALEAEIKDQIVKIENGEKILKVTKKFDEKRGKTVFIREKTSLKEYNYIPEYNIPIINWDKKTLDQFDNFKIIDTQRLRKIFIDKKYLENEIDFILSSPKIYNLYQDLLEFKINEKKVVSFLTTNLQGQFNLLKIDPLEFNLETKMISQILKLHIENKITTTKLNQFINNLLLNRDIVKELKLFQNQIQFSEQKLQQIITDIINKNRELADQYHNRPERVEKFIIGKLMKISKGKANPKLAIKLIKEYFIKNE